MIILGGSVLLVVWGVGCFAWRGFGSGSGAFLDAGSGAGPRYFCWGGAAVELFLLLLCRRRPRCFVATTLDGHYWWMVRLSGFGGAASFASVSLDAGEKSVMSAEELLRLPL